MQEMALSRVGSALKYISKYRNIEVSFFSDKLTTTLSYLNALFRIRADRWNESSNAAWFAGAIHGVKRFSNRCQRNIVSVASQ
jgi:hypothetical protein